MTTSEIPSTAISLTDRDFHLAVLGRTLDHLGRQTYKRRDVALIELVANCWDAGAHNVRIKVPAEVGYDPAESYYVIEDNGSGMTDVEVQNNYLVVGRNRREGESDADGEDGKRGDELRRPVMGRKGIGKLAGFGVAKRIMVMTWKDGVCTRVALDADTLRLSDGKAADLPVKGSVGAIPTDITTPSGTRVTLVGLKHKTPMSLDSVHEALSRRFSRRARGEMSIIVNDEPLRPPSLDFEMQVPEDGSLVTDVLPDGNSVRYSYAFTSTPIQSRDLRGFTIYVHEKTAQAPPFFFNVEGTASGQHATKYLTGEIYADYLDDGSDDDSDIVSTDRQDIDWEDERASPLLNWGDKLTRLLLREWANRKGEQLVTQVNEDVGFSTRLEELDPPSRKQLEKQLRSLGQVESNPERAHDLADALIRAYEYRHFHDVVDDIDAATANPEQLQRLLAHLADWKVLESRAVLEVVKGRLSIVDKFQSMIINNERETAHQMGQDSMHDLLASYPWLLNPEWQVMAEERTIARQLTDWNHEDVREEDARLRYDFLALTDDHRLVVVEIKRSGHAVTIEELSRLTVYGDRLSAAHADTYMLMVASRFAVNQRELDSWKGRPDGDVMEWHELHARVRRYYEHYRAVLEGDLSSKYFGLKRAEVAQTRRVLAGTVYRGQEARAAGLGPQDVAHQNQNIEPNREA